MLTRPDQFNTAGFRFISYPLLDAGLSEEMRCGRNEAEVRRWSVNQEEISAATHGSFVDSLRERDDRLYYAVLTHAGEVVGSVNLSLSGDNRAERGIWIAAAMRGKGYARKVLEEFYTFIHRSLDIDIVETQVRLGNLGSHRLEHRLGAREMRRDKYYVYYTTDLRKTVGGKDSQKRQRKRVVLRADAGSSIGFGHFVRTVALAAYLKDDFDCVVVTRNPDLGHPSDHQRMLASENGLHLAEIAGKEREEFDPLFLAMLRKDDIVVLDNYYYLTGWQREVRSRCRALVCIDDMHDRHFPADVVMTFCPLRREDFSLDAGTRFFGGPEWSFLRSPFLTPCRRQKAAMPPKRVAIAMGGADPFRLTGKIVRIIRGINPLIELEVLAGSTVKIDFEPDSRLRVHRQAGAGEIAAMFDSCDLGIFPASTVCMEAFARHLPVAAGHYVDNQEELYTYGVEHGWIAPLGCLLDDAADLEPRLRNILSSPPAPAPDFDFPAYREKITDIFRSL